MLASLAKSSPRGGHGSDGVSRH